MIVMYGRTRGSESFTGCGALEADMRGSVSRSVECHYHDGEKLG